MEAQVVIKEVDKGRIMDLIIITTII